MQTFWAALTIAVVVVILGIAAWAFLLAPFTLPPRAHRHARHSG